MQMAEFWSECIPRGCLVCCRELQLIRLSSSSVFIECAKNTVGIGARPYCCYIPASAGFLSDTKNQPLFLSFARSIGDILNFSPSSSFTIW